MTTEATDQGSEQPDDVQQHITQQVSNHIAAILAEMSKITARFYLNPKHEANRRSPVAYAEVSLPGWASGMVVEASIWADLDTRGQVREFRASLPSGYRGQDAPFRAAPMFTEAKDGSIVPVARSKDALGANVETILPVKLAEAWYAFRKTGEPVQVFTI